MSILATDTAALASPSATEEIIFAQGAHPRYAAHDESANPFTTCVNGEHTVYVAPSAPMGDDVEMLTSASAGVINVTATS